MTSKELKRTYIISDLHFFHDNIIKYCNRPFWKKDENSNELPDSAAMTEYLLRQIDSLPKDSILINLGDVCMLHKTNLDEIKRCIKRMSSNNKKLYFVLGNHDTFKKGPAELKDMVGRERLWWKQAGFDIVYDRPVFLNDLDIVLSHKPVRLKIDTTVRNIHGHTHNQPAGCEPGYEFLYRNVSCDVTGFKPVKFTDILDELGVTWKDTPFINEKEIDVEDIYLPDPVWQSSDLPKASFKKN